MNPVSHTPKPQSPKAVSGVIVPHTARWYQRLGAWLVSVGLRSLSMTLRYSWTDRSGLLSDRASDPVIFCFWHNRLALTPKAYYGFARKDGRTAGLAAMVSASKDGAFLAAILERFKFRPVRGSSSRRGRQALLELTTWAERSYDLAITPDGPRGPCYIVQDGVMSLAQITGLPIVPFSFHLNWKFRPKTWDHFQIPLPLAHCEMIFDKPIRVPREASDEERESLRQQLQDTLRNMSKD